jgi:hypothetical protein
MKKNKSKKSELPVCPFCHEIIQIGITDAEGNPKPAEYESDPWSGLVYVYLHPEKHGIFCPINTCRDEPLGKWGFESRERAIAAWNTRMEK